MKERILKGHEGVFSNLSLALSSHKPRGDNQMNNVYTFEVDSYLPNYESVGGNKQNQSEEKFMGKTLQDYQVYLAVKYRKGYTRQYYYHTVKDLCRYANKEAFEIEKNDIDKYLIYLNNKGLEHNTVNDYIIRINLFVAWIGKPELKVKRIGFRQTNRRKILGLNELVSIRHAAKRISPEHHLIAVFITDLNARPIEICNAKLSDLRDGRFYFNDSKTGDSYGFPTQDFLEALEVYKSVRPKPNDGYEDYILIGKAGRYKGRKYEGHGTRIRTVIGEVSRIAGIDKHITPYDLRASVGTQEFNQHINPKIIQRKFRHKNLKTTMLYDHVDDKMSQQYADEGLIFNKRSLLPHDEKDVEINDMVYNPFSPHELNKLHENENFTFSFSHSFFSSSFLNQRGEPYLSYFPPHLVLNDSCLFAPIPFNNHMIEAGLNEGCYFFQFSPHLPQTSCFYLPLTNSFADYYLNFLHNILQTGGGGCLES